MAQKKTILVIEDNSLNMKLMKAILMSSNYEVLPAEDAEQGLQLAHQYLPDLILMDIQLPKMDGLEATKIIKADSKLRHIPVIALTSYAMEEDRKKSLAAGCSEHITKPINPKSFLETINCYLA